MRDVWPMCGVVWGGVVWCGVWGRGRLGARCGRGIRARACSPQDTRAFCFGFVHFTCARAARANGRASGYRAPWMGCGVPCAAAHSAGEGAFGFYVFSLTVSVTPGPRGVWRERSPERSVRGATVRRGSFNFL